MQYKKEQSDLLTHKNKATQHHEWGFLTMKRNAKTIIAGMIALAISHTAMADDIKVAVVGAMSGPIAQWGDMEFNGARQAIKDINAKGELRATSWLAWNMTTPATRNKPLRSPTKSLMTALNTLLVICVLLLPNLHQISTKTKVF